VVRFTAIRLAGAVAAAVILCAAFAGAGDLLWHSVLGPTHSCTPTAPVVECRYDSRPGWVVPAAFGIAFVGLAGASGGGGESK
jgi:hypothetical protein